MRFFLELGYNGTSFHGWQNQPNARSVQQQIEEALSIMLRKPMAIVGAGRTDAGVHAREMYAHFDTDTGVDDEKRFLLSLNRLVGKNIAIRRIIPVKDDAHARFDAVSRTYKYFITYEKTPFFYPYSWHCPSRLDLEEMNRCASHLLEINDFTSFAKLHSDAKTNICKVTEARWEKRGLSDMFEDNGIVFTISADRFLRNMVRAVVGTLVDVGRGKLSFEDFKDIIASKNRCNAGVSMPAEALFLWKVDYPYIK